MTLDTDRANSEQEEPIYITKDSTDGLQLKARLNVLNSHHQGIDQVTSLRAKLIETGLTRTESEKAYSVLNRFGY